MQPLRPVSYSHRVTLAFNSMFEQYGEFAISWCVLLPFPSNFRNATWTHSPPSCRAPFYYELKCGVLVWLLLPQSSVSGFTAP